MFSDGSGSPPRDRARRIRPHPRDAGRGAEGARPGPLPRMLRATFRSGRAWAFQSGTRPTTARTTFRGPPAPVGPLRRLLGPLRPARRMGGAGGSLGGGVRVAPVHLRFALGTGDAGPRGEPLASARDRMGGERPLGVQSGMGKGPRIPYRSFRRAGPSGRGIPRRPRGRTGRTDDPPSVRPRALPEARPYRSPRPTGRAVAAADGAATRAGGPGRPTRPASRSSSEPRSFHRPKPPRPDSMGWAGRTSTPGCWVGAVPSCWSWSGPIVGRST